MDKEPLFECKCEASKQLDEIKKLVYSGAPYTAILAGIIFVLNPELKVEQFITSASSVEPLLRAISP